MEAQIRLANRRGLLTGASLSRVQERALEIMMFLEARDRWRAEDRALRLAMVASDIRMMPKVFPEMLSRTVEDVVEEDLDEGGTFEFSDDVDPEAAAQMLERLLAEQEGTMGLDDLPAEQVDEFGSNGLEDW